MKAPFATLIAIALTAGLFAGCASRSDLTAPDGDEGGGTGTPAPPNPFPTPASKTTVNGAGATFPALLLTTWGIEYAYEQPNVQVSYNSQGSGFGINAITQKTVVFGATDAPLTQAERTKTATTPNLLHIPETLGVVGIAYSGAGLPNGLQLDGEVTAKIFTGKITKWNHPDIQALNAGLTLPDQTIKVMCRSDSSGTTFVFSDWMVKTSAAWRESQGGSATKSTSAWSCNGGRFQGNENLAPNVKTTEYAIGYLEYAYIKQQSLHSAKVLNRAGEYVAISTEGGKKAAAGFAAGLPAAHGDWSTVSIVDAEGPGAYPISSFTYILVYRDLGDYEGKATANQLNAFRAWLWWCLHEGQDARYTEALGYAPLPAEVVKIGEDALHSMNV